MSFSEIEARLRRIGLRVDVAEHEVVRLRDSRGKIRQDLALISGTSYSVCPTTVSGNVISCLATPTVLVDSTVAFVGNTSGISYGTFALSLGTFSVVLFLDPSDASLNCGAIGPGSRFAFGTPQIRSVSHCTTNTISDLKATSASGYYCYPNCAFPLADIMNFEDSRHSFGNGTITRSGANWARSNVFGTYRLAGVGSSLAPGDLHIETVFSSPFVINIGSGSGACPDAVGTKFDRTWTLSSGDATSLGMSYVAGDTLRIYEP